ncbi:mucin-associated surface protein (MASP), putative, partial [Trypanosoma cruzi marinkellei]
MPAPLSSVPTKSALE